ncbi:hypothetical protein [Streptomyces ochraceiscleroticus]|uniref:Glycerophosphoryl diester phosphodiesterase membrane domain-containing protein n=1 Tax=Streptomyces ochraceiscleroticus TaxID=47761 RepID=A0ABW1MI56_9ACTN|nr:hypothetical protein [Streptomyces ochraceiscleroticus]
MTRTTPHDRTAPPTNGGPQRGVTATTFAVLRRHRGALAGATVRIVGLSGLTGLLMTAAIFALAWPVFTRMRNQRIWYHHVEDPYLHDHTDLALVALCTLPLFLLLLGAGSAALQSVCSRAVTTGTQASSERDWPRAAGRGRLRPVLTVYTLRGLVVWPLPLLVSAVANSLTGSHLDTDEQILAPGSWPHTLIAASPAAAIFAAVLLRLALALAPAAAADGLGPRAALRRSWSLMWTRAGGARVLALALPLAALTAGVLRLAVQLALPLRPLVRTLLEQATGNFFAAYYAGILAPVIVGILVTAALTLPLTYTAFAALHDHLRSPHTSPRRTGDEA